MDASSIFVETSGDANATIQVYSQVDGNIAFCLVGYWSTPPGTYNEAADALGSASSDQTWQDADLSGFGVPANAIVQIVMANAFATSKNRQGLREKGSSPDRWIDLHEAEAEGEDLATLHVNAAQNSTIEWYHEDVSETHTFYLLGWWE